MTVYKSPTTRLSALSVALSLLVASGFACANDNAVADHHGKSKTKAKSAGYYQPYHFYASGIVGASMAKVDSNGPNFIGANPAVTSRPDLYPLNSGTTDRAIATGGVALGTAFDLSPGQLRVEAEGRGRGNLSGTTQLVPAGSNATPGAGFEAFPDYQVKLTNGWSALANVWQDINLNNKFSVYGGGGVGAGGYRAKVDFLARTQEHIYGASNVMGFAWQVGAGAVYKLTDSMALDFGYRHFELNPGSTSLVYTSPSSTLSGGSYRSEFTTDEVLFSLRYSGF